MASPELEAVDRNDAADLEDDDDAELDNDDAELEDDARPYSNFYALTYLHSLVLVACWDLVVDYH